MGRKNKQVFRRNPDLVCPKNEGEMERALPCWKCPVEVECLHQSNMVWLASMGDSLK